MKKAEIYGLLESEPALPFVVTFTDGDSYQWRDLDPCASLGAREEPIHAHFSDCIGVCYARAGAYKEEALAVPNVLWTSTGPREPVGKRYYVDDIETIFDAHKDFNVYEQDT